jgi:hypothetical protein
MKIYPSDKNAVIIDTTVGSIHVYDKGASESGDVEIIFNDHCTIRINGWSKCIPTVTIDSGEYPTRLKVEETESKWIR